MIIMDASVATSVAFGNYQQPPSFLVGKDGLRMGIHTKPRSNLKPMTMEKSDEGRKDDIGKDQWSLLPLSTIEEVVKILTFGAHKYGAENWKSVNESRYKDALFRHLNEVIAHGVENDKETGFSHYAHAICNCIFLNEKMKGRV